MFLKVLLNNISGWFVDFLTGGQCQSYVWREIRSKSNPMSLRVYFQEYYRQLCVSVIVSLLWMRLAASHFDHEYNTTV